MPNNTNITIDTQSLRDTAAAWQKPELIRSASHEIRSTIWMLVILIGSFALFRVFAAAWMAPSSDPNAPTPQQISNYQTAVLNACQQDMIARGYNIYSSNNCRQIATVETYKRFGKSY